MGLQLTPSDFVATTFGNKTVGESERTLGATPSMAQRKRAETREPGFAARVQGRMHHGTGAFRRPAKRLCPRRATATS